MVNETWKPVLLPPIMEHTYEVSSNGEVVYTPTGGVLNNIYHSTNGHDFVTLMIDPVYFKEIPGVNKMRMMKVRLDWLIAMTFSIIPPNSYENAKLRHRDGDRDNHQVDNIEWVDSIEEWRCVNYSNIVDKYAVSDNGIVKELLSGKIINRDIDDEGDVVVSLLTTDGTYKLFKVHNIETHAFYGKREKNEIVNHINGLKYNCHLSNLEYIDYGENVKNGIKEGELPTDTKVKQRPDVDTMDMIRDLLFKHNGCVRFVMKDIDADEYPEIDRRVVHSVRDCETGYYSQSNKYSAEELKKLNAMRINRPKTEITPEIENSTIGLLVKYNGDVKAVCNDPMCKVSQTKVYQIKNKIKGSNRYI